MYGLCISVGRRQWALIACCMLMAGCGEVSYKRGANAGDLAQARQECASSGTVEAMSDCLEKKGWLVGNFDRNGDLDEEDPVIHATYQEDARGPAVIDKPEAASAAAKVPSEKDPLDIFAVSSWWKAGQGPTALKADSNACVAELGENHKPDSSYQKVTRGFLRCMRKRGWYALQAQ